MPIVILSLLNAGGTASGKTTVCDRIMQRLHDQCVVMLSQDSFYRGLTPEEIADVGGAPCAAAIMQCFTFRKVRLQMTYYKA